MIGLMAAVPAVTDKAPFCVNEYVDAALEPAVTYTAPAPVNENVAALEMETAIQEVSDLLASGLGEGDPELDAAWARLIELGR